MIYIIGHKKPDLDSAVAAVSLKYLFDKADCWQRKASQPVLPEPANHETKFIFKKFKTSLPQVLTLKKIKTEDKFVLVDHNEKSQRHQGIKNEQITDIFDHHKINLNLNKPIFITTKPWGSTNTIIYWLMKTNDIKPSKNIACLMLAAILSDTVGLKSSTTTEKDRQIAKELAKTGQIKNIDKLIFQIFKAKSNISDLSDKEIITKDYKVYNFAKQKVFINQLETVEQEKVIDKSEQLIKLLKKLKKEKNLDYLFCLVTDILKINSKVIIPSEKSEKILKQAFPQAKKIKKGVYNIGPRSSRKKEIAPPIENSLNK